MLVCFSKFIIYSKQYVHRSFSNSTKTKEMTRQLFNNIVSDNNKNRCVSRLQQGFYKINLQTQNKSKFKQAGIIVPLCIVDGKPSLLYTVRSRHLNDHGGEISFPGGQISPEDKTIEETALREMQEEIGVDSSSVTVWGKLCQLPSKTNIMVTAVIGCIGDIEISSLKPNFNEVAKVFAVSIESLCDLNNCHYTYFRKGRNLRHPFVMPVFKIRQYRIWGLTAIVTHEALNLIAPNLYQFRPYSLLS